jgi:hypothetical protein
MTITLRGTKGAALSYAEADGNIADLDVRTKLGWRDNIVQLASRGGPTEPPYQLFRDNIYLLAFSHIDMMEGFASFHIDHDYAMGTALYPHIHWATDTSAIGTVRWGFEYTIAKGHQQAAFGPTTTIYVEQTTTGVPYMHYIAESSDANAIPGIGIEPDTLILMRVFRDSTHPNDNLDASAFGICLDMHYQADKATTKNKAPNFFI